MSMTLQLRYAREAAAAAAAACTEGTTIEAFGQQFIVSRVHWTEDTYSFHATVELTRIHTAPEVAA